MNTNNLHYFWLQFLHCDDDDKMKVIKNFNVYNLRLYYLISNKLLF